MLRRIINQTLLTVLGGLGAEHSQSMDSAIEEVLVIGSARDNSLVLPAASVWSISKDQLQSSAVVRLPDALRQVPSVMVQKTSHGQGSPFIRGFTGYRTLLLLDGVRYNNSVYRDGPSEYFGLIDLHSIGEISVVTGPTATLHGSDAIGGAISLTTQSTLATSEAWQGSMRLSSADDSIAGRLQWQQPETERWGLRVGLSGHDTGNVNTSELGELQKTGYGEWGADLRTDWLVGQSQQITFVYQQFQQDDVWRTHSTIYSPSWQGTEMGQDLQRSKNHQRELAYARWRIDDLWHSYDASVTISQQRWSEQSIRIRGDERRSDAGFDSRMWGVTAMLNRDWRAGYVQLAGDVYVDNVDSFRTDISANGIDRVTRIQGPVGDDARYLQGGMSATFGYTPNAKWDLQAGVRLNVTQLDVGAFIDPANGQTATYSGRWTAPVGSLRVSYLPDQHQWWGAWNQSFRAPNLADVTRYGGSRSNEIEVAALGLDPERFSTYELGYRWDGVNWQPSITLFYTELSDYITSTPTGRIVSGEVEVSKQNAAQGFVGGATLATEWQPSEKFNLNANVTWLDSEIQVLSAAHNASKEPLSRTMPLTFNARLRYQASSKFWWGSTLQFAAKADNLSAGDREDTQRIPPDGTPSYWLVDVNVGIALSSDMDLTLVLGNIFNEAYRVHGSGSNEAGRHLVLAVNIAY